MSRTFHVARTAWIVQTLVVSTSVWIPFLIGNRLSGHLGDAVVLFVYLVAFHGALFAATGAVTLGALMIAKHRGQRRAMSVTSSAVRGWTWGTALGTLAAVNAVLAFPVVYGPLNSREQPFVTLLGAFSWLVFLPAPLALGLGLSGWASRRKRWVLTAWTVLFLTTVGWHLKAQKPADVALDTAVVPIEEAGSGASEDRRVVLLGFDGLSWNMILPLLELGELPELRRFLSRGARGTLATDVPTLSPAIWNTIVTGRRPADHGIFTFSKFLLPGMKTALGHGPYLSTPNWWFGLNRWLLQARFRGWVGNELYYSTERRVPAVWDVADRHGLSTGMVGWYASWPVATPASGGFRVSDFGPRSGSLFPAEEIRPLINERRPVEDVLRPPGEDPFVELVWQEAYDVVTRTGALLRRYAPRVTAVYVRFPDPLLHHAWRGERFWLTGDMPSLERLPGELVGSYRLFDLLLGRLMEAIGDDAVVFLVSDHGFRFDGRQHHHAPPGVLAVSGPGVRRGAVIEGASIYDLFPTLLSFLELPVTAHAPGRCLEEVFEPGILAPLRRVASYSWYRPNAGRSGEPSRELEEEELRRLRALGYVN